jgi:hypothetical protein
MAFARRRLLNSRLPEAGPPACFADLLRNLASGARLLVEKAALEDEMNAILRDFARAHEEFLQQQECAPAPSGSQRQSSRR